jgi:formate hydrogenlyase subunit 3/multisubunit Na+/H+ antiporter MnhD subunit
MTNIFPPAFVFLLGAIFIPFFKEKLKPVFMLILPLIAFLVLRAIPEGTYVIGRVMDQDLYLRIDKLSLFLVMYSYWIHLSASFMHCMLKKTENMSPPLFMREARWASFLPAI